MLRSRLTLARFVVSSGTGEPPSQPSSSGRTRLGVLSSAERASLYKQMNNRRWRIHEPASDEVPIEAPRLVQHVADRLAAKGLDDDEIARLAGFSSPEENQLFVPRRPDSPWRHLTSV